MVDFFRPSKGKITPQQMARSCRRLGWTGLVLQILFGFLPVLVVVAHILLNLGRGEAAAFSGGLWLAIICLILLLFSIYWCFRYILVARRLDGQDGRPAKSEVRRVLKVGLLTNLGIMLLAVVITLWRVSELTWRLLFSPQNAGLMSPGQATVALTQGTLVTPSNMITIHAMVSTVAAGLVGTIVALLMIAQVAKHRPPTDSFG
jgi:hypothetical protein